MTQTSITASVSQTPHADIGTVLHPPVRNLKKSALGQVLLTVASLRVTVTLFALALFLVFCGTLAQMNASNFTVINEYFRSICVWIPFQLFVQFGQIFFGVPKDDYMAGSFPFPGGWLLGGLLLVNLLAAHFIRFRLSWKHAGVLILHAGVVALMLGELVTGLFAIEGNMTIEQGGSSNFLEHREFVELAVIDVSDPKIEDVRVIPGRLVRQGGLIQNEQLPFDVEVLRYMTNSAIVPAKQAPAGAANPADRGDGRETVAVEKPETSGTDTEQKINLPSAYVTFRKKDSGESLGTYLVSLWLTLTDEDRPQQLTLDGKTYNVSLRFKRTYKPYTIYLKHFDHKVYPGTTKPKDFSSYVRLVDPSRGEDREVRIWMNNPLRYAGETFYQSSFLPGDRGTVLQVVRNPGWLLPYISCVLVAVGMLLHFGLKLAEFLNGIARQRGLAPNAADPRSPDVTPRGFLAQTAVNLFLVAVGRKREPLRNGPTPLSTWLVPLVVLALAGGYVCYKMIQPRDAREQFHFQEAANLPILDRGRIKPLDTVARTDLMLMSGRQEFVDKDGNTQPAIKWALDVMTSKLSPQSSEAALSHKVFRIENLEVLNLLGLEPRSGFRYAASEFADKIDKIEESANRAQKREEKDRDLFDVKIMELAQRLSTYMQLAELKTLLLVPPPPGGHPDDWKSVLVAFQEEQEAGAKHNPATIPLSKVLVAYARGDAEQFNEELATYRKLLDQQLPVPTNMASLEVFFNHFAPFYQCCGLYVVAFVLACLSWLGWREPLRRSAFWLLVLTLAVHTWALLVRMHLQGRPPVTNLFSSAVFIGWGCVLLGIVLEMIFRVGIGTAVGAILGFVTVLISHHLAASGDTLVMMEAVLDTNFWLATHVVAVTLGYTASFVAGALGIVYLISFLVTKLVDSRQKALEVQLRSGDTKVDMLRMLGQMIYGTICFATLLSFVGTVLGGIWADQSWGRFWGWDPKENGAVMIVIWNALILHARWSGMVKQPGVALLAVVGNMITAFSWFGTNQLSVGLHNYGFNSTLALGLRWFWVSQCALILLALPALPRWRKA